MHMRDSPRNLSVLQCKRGMSTHASHANTHRIKRGMSAHASHANLEVHTKGEHDICIAREYLKRATANSLILALLR